MSVDPRYEYKRAYRLAHRKEQHESQRRNRAAHPEKLIAYREKNREKARAYNKAYQAANHDKLRIQRRSALIKRLYGLSVEDYENMLVNQQFQCAICPSTNPGWKQHWAIDHCHDTGKVRGLLCAFCNTMFGLAKDNPVTLRAAATYVEFHQ